MSEKTNTVNAMSQASANCGTDLFAGLSGIRIAAVIFRALIGRVRILLDTRSLTTVVVSAISTFLLFGIGAFRPGAVAAAVFFLALRPFVGREAGDAADCGDFRE